MITTTSRLTSFVFAGALTALATATTSFAAPATKDPASVSVRYDDLDLSTSTGANALYRRITLAARRVCPDPYSRDLGIALASQRCLAAAVGTAVRELNSPQLAQVYASHVSHG
jgi:UrcA family protein